MRARRDKAPGVIDLLLVDAPGILKASQKQLREKSLKTRTGVLVLLKELLATLPDSQMQDVDQLLPGVISAMNVCTPSHAPRCLQLGLPAHQSQCCFLIITEESIASMHTACEVWWILCWESPASVCCNECRDAPSLCCVQEHSSNSSQLRIQALQFLGVALKSSSPAVWQGHVKSMTSPIIAAAGERYSMVSAEGLRVCESLVHIMRPDLSKPMPPSHKVRGSSRATDAPSWLNKQQGFTLTIGPRINVHPLAGQHGDDLPCFNFGLGGIHECPA